MMLTKDSLAVVIPAYNEVASITGVVNSVKLVGAVPLVVDDGSTDATADLAKSLGAILLSHGSNRGYEAALNTGVDEALKRGFGFVATFDADAQMNAHDLLRLYNYLVSNDLDLVVGIRNYRNRFSEHLLGVLAQWRFGIIDPLCGLKIYRLSSASPLLPFDRHNLVGMELAMRMVDSGLACGQLKIDIYRRTSGHSRYGSSFRGEWRLIRALIRLIQLFGLSKSKKSTR